MVQRSACSRTCLSDTSHVVGVRQGGGLSGENTKVSWVMTLVAGIIQIEILLGGPQPAVQRSAVGLQPHCR